MTWHRFLATSDDDLECVSVDCGVVVDERAMRLLTVECPAPPCSDDTNAGGCVYVPADRGPECAYCGRSGGSKGHVEDPDEADLEDLLAQVEAGIEVDLGPSTLED